MRVYLWIIVLLLALPGLVRAGTIPAPKLVPGQYVYTVPPNFDPPMIGRYGLREIQQAAKQLHYPFYVVVAKSIPGEDDEDAAAAIDGLAEEWARNPRYNVGTSSIFLLSFSPRKYRVLAGLRWKNKLGLERDALYPYTAIFEESVQGTPKDPKSGIINLMRQFDADIFDRTDPKRVAARQAAQRKAEAAQREAERKAALEQQLRDARGRLDAETVRMKSLIEAAVASNVAVDAGYAAELAKTTTIRGGTDTDKMYRQAEVLSGMNDRLSTAVSAVQAAQAAEEERIRRAQEVEAAKRFSLGVLIAGCLLALGLYTGMFVKRRRRFAQQARAWRAKLDVVKQQYDRFYQEYTVFPHEPGMTGETLQLISALEADATTLYLSVLAMERHIDECETMGKRATFLQPGVPRAALAKLTGEFTCNTAQIAATEVFKQDWPILTLQPSEFMTGVDDRISALTARWQEYQADVKQHETPAENQFGQAKLDELLQQADANHIPHRWLDDHPLFGDDAADRALYTRVNQDRERDPVGYAHKLQALYTKETEVADRLARAIAAQAAVDGKRLAAAPTYDRTVLAPPDDPAVIFEQARHEDQRVAACLANRVPIEELEAQARKAVELYERCMAQAEIVRGAIVEAAATLLRGQEQHHRAAGAADRAAMRVDAAGRVYLHTAGPESLLQQGQHLLNAGGRLLDEAQRQLADLCHLEALRGALKAQSQLDEAEQAFADCQRQCDELDEQKEAFERKLMQLESAREDAAERIRRYGGSPARLPDMPDVYIGDRPADYVTLLSTLNSFEDEVNAEVRHARQQYEAEEHRREESMHSSFSSISHSSSSSFGSSSSGSSISHSSSSSGGSISRGGSSSAGGSW